MKTGTRMVMALVLGASAAGRAAEVQLRDADGQQERNHSVYVGIGYGPTQLKTSGDEREVEGINFTFDTEADDLGGMAYLGYWITDHVGVEIGGRDYGSINVPFSFHDPHDNTSGTGESDVSINGFNISLLLGFDITREVQVVGRAGALSWTEKFDSRFDIPGQPAIHAETEDSGTSPALGLGITYRFTPGWQLDARYEHASLDEDSVSLVTVGLSYDFIGLGKN